MLSNKPGPEFWLVQGWQPTCAFEVRMEELFQKKDDVLKATSLCAAWIPVFSLLQHVKYCGIPMTASLIQLLQLGVTVA